jgi:hypothetical protein
MERDIKGFIISSQNSRVRINSHPSQALQPLAFLSANYNTRQNVAAQSEIPYRKS